MHAASVISTASVAADSHSPADTPSEDVAVLAQVLNAQAQMNPEDRLSQALGWDVDRLRTAITTLDVRLNLIGLRVHRNSMGVCIRANDKRASHAVTRLTSYKDADDGIAHGTARVLYAAYRGTLSVTDTSTDRMMQLGALTNRGAITVSSGVGSRVQLTDDTAYAFDISR
jgi:hypothetical protein